ncbi:unnamed protein product [Choristocarpus tenellus]
MREQKCEFFHARDMKVGVCLSITLTVTLLQCVVLIESLPYGAYSCLPFLMKHPRAKGGFGGACFSCNLSGIYSNQFTVYSDSPTDPRANESLLLQHPEVLQPQFIFLLANEQTCREALEALGEVDINSESEANFLLPRENPNNTCAVGILRLGGKRERKKTSSCAANGQDVLLGSLDALVVRCDSRHAFDESLAYQLSQWIENRGQLLLLSSDREPSERHDLEQVGFVLVASIAVATPKLEAFEECLLRSTTDGDHNADLLSAAIDSCASETTEEENNPKDPNMVHVFSARSCAKDCDSSSTSEVHPLVDVSSNASSGSSTCSCLTPSRIERPGFSSDFSVPFCSGSEVPGTSDSRVSTMQISPEAKFCWKTSNRLFAAKAPPRPPPSQPPPLPPWAQTNEDDTKEKVDEALANVLAEAVSSMEVYGAEENNVTTHNYFSWQETFPGIRVLSEGFSDILEECLTVSGWKSWPEKHYTEGEGQDWKVFPFVHTFPASDPSQTTWVESTCHMCPKTTELLHKVPNIRTALFSRLGAGSRISGHRGWADLANHVLRCHLPLVVPNSGACGLWVEGEVRYHVEGEVLVFDDSKLHKAFNESDGDRLVLIVDILRPPGMPLGTAEGGHTPELDNFIAAFS